MWCRITPGLSLAFLQDKSKRMASTNRTQHGASARAGRTSSARKAPANRVPARTSRTPGKTSAVKKSAPKAKQRPGGLPVLPVAIVVALALLGWFLYPMARLHYIEQRKVAQLQTQLTSIQQRNKKLRAEVDKLKTPEGVEQAAHELGLARRGEQVWVSVQDGKVRSAPTTATPLQAASVAPGGWTRFLDTIFGVGGQ